MRLGHDYNIPLPTEQRFGWMCARCSALIRESFPGCLWQHAKWVTGWELTARMSHLGNCRLLWSRVSPCPIVIAGHGYAGKYTTCTFKMTFKTLSKNGWQNIPKSMCHSSCPLWLNACHTTWMQTTVQFIRILMLNTDRNKISYSFIF